MSSSTAARRVARAVAKRWRCCTQPLRAGASAPVTAAHGTHGGATAGLRSRCAASVPRASAAGLGQTRSHSASSMLRGMAAQVLAREESARVGLISTDIIDEPCVDVLHSLPEADTSMTGRQQATQLDLSEFPAAVGMDPFKLAADDLEGMTARIKEMLGVDHPVLSTVAKYFFEIDGGKKIRPTMVSLMSRALIPHAADEIQLQCDGGLLPSQRRLAEITEMIHTASLLHDDVIDLADTRRGVGSVNSVFGNQLAVLAGDFLLARACVSLARLRSVEVVELLASVIEHLVKGEVMQMSAAFAKRDTAAAFEMYMSKTYYKTASLMANSCKASAMLACVSEEHQEAAFLYGKHIGLAFQLVDDLLDFESTQDALGKPTLNDLQQGLATAPVLFACREFPSLMNLIDRKFKAAGDVEEACEHVQASNGMQRTRELATGHAQAALDALTVLHPSPERDALAAIAFRVVNRKF